MVRRLMGALFAGGLLGGLLAAAPAEAAVKVRVDLSSQTMEVRDGAGQTYLWPISTARRGYRTPRGTYGVQSLQAMHYSRKYHWSPMPHSIFFAGGYAIHGTYETGALGRPASHGCIRLAPGNAALLYRMVAAEGARITIAGSREMVPTAAARHRVRARPFQTDSGFPEYEPAAEIPAGPSSEDWMVEPDPIP